MSKIVHTIKVMLNELEFAKAHYRIYSDLTAAINKEPSLNRYRDFFDTTIFAHFSGMIMSISRLLDRHKDTASIHWLLRYIENHPAEFDSIIINAQNIRSRLDSLSGQQNKVRQIRNKRMAHKERLDKSESEEFWAKVGLAQQDVERLLAELQSILREITRGHKEHDWRWVMIAIDEETSELLESLTNASA
jgi:hypothetical protein